MPTHCVKSCSNSENNDFCGQATTCRNQITDSRPPFDRAPGYVVDTTDVGSKSFLMIGDPSYKSNQGIVNFYEIQDDGRNIVHIQKLAVPTIHNSLSLDYIRDKGLNCDMGLGSAVVFDKSPIGSGKLRCAVGMPNRENVGGLRIGGVAIYSYDANATDGKFWTLDQTIVSCDENGGHDSGFGSAIDLCGNHMIVGAPLSSEWTIKSGIATLYQYSDDTGKFEFIGKLRPNKRHRDEYSNFGHSVQVCLNNGAAVYYVGAIGGAYQYKTPASNADALDECGFVSWIDQHEETYPAKVANNGSNIIYSGKLNCARASLHTVRTTHDESFVMIGVSKTSDHKAIVYVLEDGSVSQIDAPAGTRGNNFGTVLTISSFYVSVKPCLDQVVIMESELTDKIAALKAANPDVTKTDDDWNQEAIDAIVAEKNAETVELRTFIGIGCTDRKSGGAVRMYKYDAMTDDCKSNWKRRVTLHDSKQRMNAIRSAAMSSTYTVIGDSTSKKIFVYRNQKIGNRCKDKYLSGDVHIKKC